MIKDGDTTSKSNLKELARDLLHLRLTDVVPSTTNPRLNMEKESFQELKQSIEQNGLLQPIVVRPVGDKYEIIGGHRRFAAVTELHAEKPSDKRFAQIAAAVRDVEDSLVPVLQLVENINRSDLTPIEVAEGIAKALDAGVHAERLAEQLGWTRRNLARYVQLHDAPAWLKEMAREVKVTKKKLDARGNPVLDPKSDKPVLVTDKLPGLAFTYVVELVTLYNLLREHDKLQLDELGGDAFKPQAERVVRKLGVAAAVEGWSTAKLRGEIKRAKDPKPAQQASAPREGDAPILIVRERRLSLDLGRAAGFSPEELAAVAATLTQALKDLGFKKTLVSV